MSYLETMLNRTTSSARRSFLRMAGSAVAVGVTARVMGQPVLSQGVTSAADFLNSTGACLHLGMKQTPYFSNFEKITELLKDIGIRHLRDDANYASYYNRDNEFYKRVRVLVGMGFRFDLVCFDPLNRYVYTPPRKLPDIYDWCDQGVEIFEGANEPSLVSNAGINPAISADHQRALYAAVKGNENLKNIVVASPSYIFKNVEIAENLSDAVDWINIHPYPGMEHPETKGPGALAGFIAGAERTFGKKPVLVSETGYHTAVQTTKPHLPVSEEIKTRYMPRLLLWNFINGVKKTYIYEFMDSWDRGLGDPESHFGLVDFTGNPKPSFAAVKRLLSLFSRPARKTGAGQDLKFNINGDTKDLWTASFRRDDGSFLLFLWLGVSGWTNASRTPLAPVTRQYTLTLTPGPREITYNQFQDDGSLLTKKLGAANGGFEMPIGDQVVALEIAA